MNNFIRRSFITFSRIFNIPCLSRVPQGSILGPLLFSRSFYDYHTMLKLWYTVYLCNLCNIIQHGLNNSKQKLKKIHIPIHNLYSFINVRSWVTSNERSSKFWMTNIFTCISASRTSCVINIKMRSTKSNSLHQLEFIKMNVKIWNFNAPSLWNLNLFLVQSNRTVVFCNILCCFI